MSHELLKSYEFVKGRGSMSASQTDTFIVEHKLTKKRYFVKLFVKSFNKENPEEYALLKQERQVYRFLKQKLFPYNIRNILYPFQAQGPMTKLTYKELFQLVKQSSYNKLTSKQIRENIIVNTMYMMGIDDDEDRKPLDAKRVHSPHMDPYVEQYIERTVYKFIMTPLVGEIEYDDYSDFLEKNKKFWTPKTLSRYMAVLLLTIYQMAKVGINQNDLHFGNILISDQVFGPTPYYSRTYLIVTRKLTYIVDNKYTLFIYDFDRSAVRGRYNPILESTEHAGNCPEFHPKRDILKIICSFYQHIFYLTRTHLDVYPYQDQLLDTVIPNPTLRDRIKQAKKHCYLSPQGSEHTSLYCMSEVLNDGVLDVEKILKFFFKQADFKTVETCKLVQNHPEALQKVSKAMIKDFLWTPGYTKMDMDMKRYVEANVQFPYAFEKKYRQTIIDNIYKAIEKTIR